MISLILCTYSPDRVQRTNDLIKMLRLDSGVEVEIILVTDNPETFDSYYGADIVVKLPRRIGWNRAMNIGEKFAKHTLCWWIDDYVIPEVGWGPKAEKGFWERFPDGQGIMEISGYETDCPKSISTRSFMYEINGGNWLWSEYLHCGNTETWHKVTALNKFQVYPEILWNRDKIFDACKTETNKAYGFDIPLREERMAKGWPLTRTPDLRERMLRWALETKDEKMMTLYKNIYNEWEKPNETNIPIGA